MIKTTGNIAKIEAELRRVEVAIKQETEPRVGSVIVFTKTFGSRGVRYTYVAHRGPGGWSITGHRPHYTWLDLLGFVGQGESRLPVIEIVTKRETLI